MARRKDRQTERQIDKQTKRKKMARRKERKTERQIDIKTNSRIATKEQK